MPFPRHARSALSAALLACALAHGAQAAGEARPRPAAAKSAPAPAGNAELGREKADAERCIECHGAEGEGAGHSNGPEGKFAKLAGQHPDYLMKQLRDFRSGARKHDVMGMMARSVDEADLRDIVAFFASRPPMQGDGAEGPAAGRALYLQGDAARGIAACASCHGEDGRGSAAASLPVPRIGGQEWLYLERQLLDWRSGWRRNSPGGVMSQAVKSLTDAEIQVLASHLAGLRPPRP